MPRIRFGLPFAALVSVGLCLPGCGSGGTTGLAGGFSAAEVSFGDDDGARSGDAGETGPADAGGADVLGDVGGDAGGDGDGDGGSTGGSDGGDCGFDCDVLTPGGDAVGDAGGDGTGPGSDSGSDSSSDSSSDGGSDGGSDSSSDGGSDSSSSDSDSSSGSGSDGDGTSNSDSDSSSGGDVLAPDAGETAPTPLSSCTGKEGDKACSADAKVRLECINGAWTPIAHCGFGVCSEKANASGPPTLLCSVPETTLTAAASACARYLPCFAPDQGMEACMRAVLTPNLVASDVAKGVALPVAVAAMTSIGPVAACVAAATSCPTVAACLQPQNPPSCASASAMGCDAAFAYACSGGAPLVADCAAIGTSCLMVGSSPRCVVDQPCPAGNISTCDGRVATACVGTSVGNRAIQVDCGALGLGCAAGKAVLPAAEQACGAQVPCPAGLVASCAGGGPSQCVAGKHVETSCGAGEICLYADEFDVGGVQCPPLSSCEAVRCSGSASCSHAARCQGAEVWYCEQGKPRRFDCKTVGKGCAAGAAPRCN